ncbi:MAG TPA: PqqD family protein [Bacteroidales bacterium]|jgi:methyltransferase-like protein|nr:PqqD family peptide modification chaperone [Bacteroidales bacterium]OQB61357.1 MAG: pyrroloquinoline quinone biosynthesis protein PqqD [Bacteroidetes bacterium ADurb.Bin145]NMD01718.1 PqqD family protein [Bacteroidales bacterium]HOU01697.1 PqqD family protein [Bacteroidales bacterium]HQG63578.1 PqqD family protein [Bacteroidales bacterium]
MIDLKSVLSHSSSVVTRKTGNEYVLVPISDNVADMDSVYTLNETGAFIWELIDGKKSVSDLIKALAEEYKIDIETAESDVLSFINKMKEYLMVK